MKTYDQAQAILCNTITLTIAKIDRELKGVEDKGIFFAPELHIAFECGRSIAINGPEIWKGQSFAWEREIKLADYGIADLFFRNMDNTGRSIVIEFKVLQTIHSYKRDIEKLQQLDSNDYDKYFCALLGFFKGQQNEHIDALEDRYGKKIELLTVSEPSETWSLNYQQKLYFATAIWAIR